MSEYVQEVMASNAVPSTRPANVTSAWLALQCIMLGSPIADCTMLYSISC